MTDAPKRRGPRSDYGPKDKPTVSVSLTRFAKRILFAAAERERRRRKAQRPNYSNVFEELLRRYGGTI